MVIPELDADGGEWTPPYEYDAVAIHDMAKGFKANPKPGHTPIASAWQQTNGRYEYAFENPEAWDILAEDAPDRGWLFEMVATLVDLPASRLRGLLA